MDRDNRQFFDVLFDKQVGQGKVGEVGSGPGEDFPDARRVLEVADYQRVAVEPSGGLPVDSEYKVELDLAKIVQAG